MAESSDRASAAIQAIAVTYEVLPHTFEADDALRPDALAIYPSGNVLSAYAVKHGDLEAAFAASDIILETGYRTSFQEHATLDARCHAGLS